MNIMKNETLEDLLKFEKKVQKVAGYFGIAILLIGTAGNSLTLLAMTRCRRKKSSFTVYLSALAVFDFMTLISWAPKYVLLDFFGVDATTSCLVLCKLSFIGAYWGQHTSSWLVVVLTGERFYCTYFPVKSQQFIRVKTGIITVAVLSSIIFLINSHMLFGLAHSTYKNQTVCDLVDRDYKMFFHFYFSWIDLSVLFLFPALLIISGNIATVIKIFSTGRKVCSMSTHSLKNQGKQLLKITVIVSVAFIVMVGPLAIFVVVDPYVYEENAGLYNYIPGNKQQIIVLTTVTTLSQVNHCSNFFLYVLSSSRFREDLKLSVRCCCCRVPQDQSSYSSRKICRK